MKKKTELPPETPTQIAVRQWWTARLAPRGQTAGWGRTKDGRYLTEHARDLEAAWVAAQQDGIADTIIDEILREEKLEDMLRTARDYVAADLEREKQAFKGHEYASSIKSIEEDLRKIDELLNPPKE